MTMSEPAALEREVIPCWICGEPCARLASYLPLSMFSCASCGLCFQPEVDSDQVRAAYDVEYFENYGNGNPYDESERQRRYEARVRVSLIDGLRPRSGRLVEVGSASGFFLSEAQRAGWTAIGIEPCEPVAQTAIERLNTRTIVGFVEDVDLEPGGFDLVCGWHVLEHIPDPVPTLERLRQALRPGGYAAFEVPNFGGVYSRRDGPRWRHLDPAHHVGQFSPASIGALFRRAGFVDVQTTTVSMFAYVPVARAIRPRYIARRARYALATRTTGYGSHPDRFELLRIVARAPDASHRGGPD